MIWKVDKLIFENGVNFHMYWNISLTKYNISMTAKHNKRSQNTTKDHKTQQRSRNTTDHKTWQKITKHSFKLPPDLVSPWFPLRTHRVWSCDLAHGRRDLSGVEDETRRPTQTGSQCWSNYLETDKVLMSLRSVSAVICIVHSKWGHETWNNSSGSVKPAKPKMMWPPPKYVPVSVSWSEQGEVLLLAFGPSISSSFILKSRTHPMTLSMGTLCPWGRTRRGSICTQANVGKYVTRLLIQTFVFLLTGSPPRYTGLCSSNDDPSLFGRCPSVTRTPSTSRWKVLFSTLNSTCTETHTDNLSSPQSPQSVKLNRRPQNTVTLWKLEGRGQWTQQLCSHFSF